MKRDIKRLLIKRLVAGWVLLSVVIGSLVAYVELERIDKDVVELAEGDSVQLVGAYLNYHSNPQKNMTADLIETAQKIVELNKFVLVEFYNLQKEKIAGYSLPGIQDITEALELEQHDFLMGEEIDYMKTIHRKNIYLKIVIPITTPQNDRIIGYFEGIYHVAEKDKNRIIQGVVWSIVQVIMVIFLTTLIFYPVIISLNRDLLTLTSSLAKANIGMLKVLGSAIAKRDSDTNAHNYRVTIYAICLAEQLGLCRKEMQALIKGAFLHDIGKIAISDTILLKPGKLTTQEFEVMKTHVSHGVDILANYEWLQDAVPVVQNHHEKYEGNGYLGGLQKNEIPKAARIFAIADVFDALTSKRPYKAPFSYEKSVSILQESRGTHFDPDILDTFLDMAPELYTQAQVCGNETESELNKLLDKRIEKYFPV